MDDPVLYCVRLYAVPIPVFVSPWTRGLFVYFLWSVSPTQCRVVYDVSILLSIRSSRVIRSYAIIPLGEPPVGFPLSHHED